jgi:hypothetical protein
MRPTDVRKDWSLDYVSTIHHKVQQSNEEISRTPIQWKIVVFMVTKNPGQSQFTLMNKCTDYNGCLLTEKFVGSENMFRHIRMKSKGMHRMQNSISHA